MIGVGSIATKSVYLGDTKAKAVYLGTEKVWNAGIQFADNFNRANGNVGNGWLMRNSSVPTIASNRIGQNASNNGGDFWALRPEGLTDDQFSECVLAGSKTNRDASVLGLSVRSNSDRTKSVTAYVGPNNAYIHVDPGTGGEPYSGYKVTAAYTFLAGQLVRFEASGNVYTLRVNGTSVLTWTDSTSAVTKGSGYRYVGWSTRNWGTDQSWALDDWAGGDL